MGEKDKQINRREFLKQMGMGVAALGTLPTTKMFGGDSRVIGANDRIRIGIIGAGDREQQDFKSALAQPNVECVAVADVFSELGSSTKAPRSD